MESGAGQSIQEKLQCIINKINGEQLKNRVTDWQRKLVATASSKFSFDSSSQVSSETKFEHREVINAEADVEYVDGGDLKDHENERACFDGKAELLESYRASEEFDEFGEGKMEGEVPMESKMLSPIEEVPRNKSPVQLWVDSLVDEHARGDEEMPPVVEADQNDAEVESFSLGAEAPGVICPRPYPFVQVTAHGGSSDAGSHSSMESLLEARKPDPEEMLMDLGFGGCEEPDIISRIPDRFLRPSSMKGIAIDDFLRHQKMMAHQFQSGFSGYRGLTGPSHAMPSGIVGKIMDRLLEAEVGRQNQEDFCRAQRNSLLMNGVLQHCQASQTQGGYSPKLARLTHSLMMKMRGTKTESVLSPENRNWYENQGDKSPDPSGTRLIIGRRSYTFAKDGNLIEDPLYVSHSKVCSSSLSPTGHLESVDQNCSSRRSDTKPNGDAVTSVENEKRKRSNDKSSSRADWMLLQVEEEDESPSIPLIECEENINFLQTKSTLYGSASSLKSSIGPRRSLPETMSIQQLDNMVLDEIQSNDFRRKSLAEDLCSACGSRKTSASEAIGPVAKRSKSPSCDIDNLSPTDILEVNCDNLCSKDNSDVNSVEYYVDRRESISKNDPVNPSNNDISESESGISEPTSLHSGSSYELVAKMLPPTVLSDEKNSTSNEKKEPNTSFSCVNAAEDTSVSDSSSPSTPSSNSFDQEEAELEYRNLILLASQLQGSSPSVIVGTEEEFLALNRDERRNMQVAVIEEALQTYQKKLKELDLRGHLRDLLTGQLLKVTDLLDSTSSPNVLKIMKQMTTLLRHQESLRQELDLHERRFGNHSSKTDT